MEMIKNFCLLAGMALWSVGQVEAAGLLTPTSTANSELKIVQHHVDVVIEDGYAITTIEQKFHNPHNEDLEAVYSFPIPEQAAVAQFTMWIDGQPIHGEVLEKEEARNVYEDQKQQGNDTGLAEQNGFQTFEMNVSPVRAGQDTRILFRYMQPAHVDLGIGRYVYPLEEGGVDEQALSFWTTNSKVEADFQFNLTLRSEYPIDALRLPNHPQAQIANNGDIWKVHLNDQTPFPQALDEDMLVLNPSDDGETAGMANGQGYDLDRDIVVYFKHAENLPASLDLTAYKLPTESRGTFMLTLTPGMDLQPITEGRDWVFILDISGSMQGKYATLAEGVRQALQGMNSQDRFRIITFNHAAREITSGYQVATPQAIQNYIQKVENIQPNGSTNLYDGLQLGLKRLDADRTSSLFLVTDGVANVGVTQQKDFIQLIKTYDTRLFTFIMGNSANRPMLKAMTDASNGFAISVSNSDDIIGKILLAKSKVMFESLHGTKLSFKGVKVTDVTPKDIGNLYRGEQLIVMGHYFGSGDVTVTLDGKISGEDKSYASTFQLPDAATDNPEIERLWAYAQIERMQREIDNFGEKADLKQSITDIAVEYGLVTNYTSMLILRDEEFDRLGIERRNADRIEIEEQSRTQRRGQPVQSRRVDTQQPMFNGSRPSTTYQGNAGALDPISLLLAGPFLWGLRKRKLNQHDNEDR